MRPDKRAAGEKAVLPPPQSCGLDLVADQAIRQRALAMLGKAGLRRQDLGDIRQHLACALLERMVAFDPGNGAWGAFVFVVVKNAGADLVRYRRRHRLGGPAIAFSELDDTRRASRLEEDRAERFVQIADLRLDVTEAIRNLPPRLRELATGLLSTNLNRLAKRQGKPRTTVNDARRALQRRFQSWGLDEHMGGRRSRGPHPKTKVATQPFAQRGQALREGSPNGE